MFKLLALVWIALAVNGVYSEDEKVVLPQDEPITIQDQLRYGNPIFRFMPQLHPPPHLVNQPGCFVPELRVVIPPGGFLRPHPTFPLYLCSPHGGVTVIYLLTAEDFEKRTTQ